MKPVQLIIDTDIGPDCDDAGALACAHALHSRGLCTILAVTHCTSSPYGAGCADAINRWYGRGDIPVGTLKSEGFLCGPEYMKYNRAIARQYPNRYPEGAGVPDATAVLREALCRADDGEAVVCAIGPLVNLSRLLRSGGESCPGPGGAALVRRKVKRLVVMGGGWKDAEWNFKMDPSSAADVCENWPSQIWFSPYEVGGAIITGKNWDQPWGTNPVCDAYRLYSPEGRMSWDLTAVWAAVMGSEPLFSLTESGTVTVDGDGSNRWHPRQGGRHRFLIKAKDDEQIRQRLDDLLRAGHS